MTTIWSGYNLVSCLHAQGTEVVNEPQELDVGDLFSSFTDVSWGSLLTSSVMVFQKTLRRALARWRQAGPKAVSVLVSPRLKTKTLTACLHFSKHCLEKTSLKLGCVFFFIIFLGSPGAPTGELRLNPGDPGHRPKKDKERKRNREPLAARCRRSCLYLMEIASSISY